MKNIQYSADIKRLIAFDVETPNAANDRMSAIGITIIEDGAAAGTFTSLVNPETHFDRFNVALTGITPELAADAPSFPRLWPEIGPLLQSGLLAAHNAPFDLRVLALCLRSYGLDAPRYLPYVCTVQMGRRCYPELSDHRLDTLCRCCGIALDHHRAGSDSRACGELVLNYLRRGLTIAPFVRTYDLWDMRTLRRSEKRFYT